MNNKFEPHDQLNAFIDDELDPKQREEILEKLDNEPELKGEICDAQRLKDLMNFAYPIEFSAKQKRSTRVRSYGAIAASLLLVLGLGFVGGYMSRSLLQKGTTTRVVHTSTIDTTSSSMQAVALSSSQEIPNKVIIYLGHSQKEKFIETLNKAEEMLDKYRQDGTEVYVVTSAGGIDLLRANDTAVQRRIAQMKDLHPTLHFVACNNQIYQLHRKGHPVNLIKEAEVAPSAVQFVVDHLTKGWKYIAI